MFISSFKLLGFVYKQLTLEYSDFHLKIICFTFCCGKKPESRLKGKRVTVSYRTHSVTYSSQSFQIRGCGKNLQFLQTCSEVIPLRFSTVSSRRKAQFDQTKHPGLFGLHTAVRRYANQIITSSSLASLEPQTGRTVSDSTKPTMPNGNERQVTIVPLSLVDQDMTLNSIKNDDAKIPATHNEDGKISSGKQWEISISRLLRLFVISTFNKFNVFWRSVWLTCRNQSRIWARFLSMS